METLHIENEKELIPVVQKVYSLVVKTPRNNAGIIALTGDLGAGKTTFVQILARTLGISEDIQSPTYLIMKKYLLPESTSVPFSKLIHIDAYRIEEDEEMHVLGFPKLFEDTESLFCIEWAEKIQNLLPQNAISVTLTRAGEESRTVTIDAP